MECPICGGKAEWEESLGFFVCISCREILTRKELVKRATWRTRHLYHKRNHPNASRGWLRENGYLR